MIVIGRCARSVFWLVIMFFFKQRAAYEMRMSDWSSDVCSSDLVCARHDVAFILNDRMDLAHQLGADGVHLGQGDGDPREARRLLGPAAQIGVTCHDSRHLAMEAGEAGAAYVASGAFYPTTTQEERKSKRLTSTHTCALRMPASA